MLFLKFYKNIVRDNSSYKYMILFLLLEIVLMISSISKSVAYNYNGPEGIEDLKSELEMLGDNECATIVKGFEDGSYVVEVTTGCEMIYMPTKVKADVVAERVISSLEEYAFVIVTRANDEGCFYIFNPSSYVESYMYGGMYGGMYGSMLGGIYGGMYGGMLGGMYGGMYGNTSLYGYGMNPIWDLSGLFGLYGNMQGTNTSLYNGIGGYGNSLYLNNSSANGFISPSYIGYPMPVGYPGLMLSNFLIPLLGNIPLYNRPTAIPSATAPAGDTGLYRKSHGLINPVFPGLTLTPGFSLQNFTSGYPMSPFQGVLGGFNQASAIGYPTRSSANLLLNDPVIDMAYGLKRQ